MKIITLNVWGGHLLDDLLMFFEQHQQIDIFCLQEVYHNTKNENFAVLPEVVSDHAALYADFTLSPVDSRTNQKCNHHKQA